MSVLVSERCANELKGNKLKSKVGLHELLNTLENIDENTLDSNPKIQKIKENNEVIYVLKHRDIRIFFTKNNDEIVLLSIISKNG